MEFMSSYYKEQYEFVKESREVLFGFCKKISEEDFVNQNSSFGRGGSIRNLLVHVANTYEYWIANLALNKNIIYAEYENFKNIQDVIILFNTIDDFMFKFISELDYFDNGISYKIKNINHSTKPLRLFSHVITHEYHHKGQILSLARHLEYIPVDTDIMR
ncbi:damage-inducible protein DinB [Flavobacterium cheongpyeongense]|uniref:Damage-inducible protein DinB n=2 Tax=Flavobacterium cheongpyeongense TaxID=2212651 RepID=A0A2V4BQN4_9FLAO|nr:damage-inducible protein DinB [Flavobacterium cheongpyeongense]